MLQKGITAFAIIVVAMSAYDLLTDNHAMLSVMLLSASILLLLAGISEIKKNKKGFIGYVSITACLLTTYAFINLFF